MKKQFESKRSEEKKSKENLDRLMTPFNIEEAINKAGIAVAIVFFVADFLLNQNGYAFMVKDGQFKIDTLESRQFQREIVRNARK